MKLDKKDLLLYAVTDRTWLKDEKLSNQVEQAINGGVTFVQIREKDLEHHEFVKEALEVKKVTDKYKIPYVINDNIDVAQEVNADGVHIGQDDLDLHKTREKLGKDKIIGLSVQTVAQAILGEKEGADYLGVGAVFSTNTKLNACDVDIETVKEICKSVKIPVIAIGGIGQENMEMLKDCGICGVAVVSAIFSANDIKNTTVNLKKLASDCFC